MNVGAFAGDAVRGIPLLLFRSSPLLVAAFLLAACGRSAPEHTQTPGGRMNPLLPVVSTEGGFVGSAVCRDCHADEHGTWSESFHSRMTQVVSTNSVVADFDGVTLAHGTERFHLGRSGDEHWVEIEDLEEPPGPDGERERVRIPMLLVTGSHHMQVFWLPTGNGNAQLGFPFTWLIGERRWVPREDAFIRDPHAGQMPETWNMTCIRCHVTAGVPAPNKAEQRFDTRLAELGIACEACHGPGEGHALIFMERAANRPDPAGVLDRIIHPEKVDHVRSAQVCGSCHAIKWFDAAEGWTTNGFRFRPGDDLETTTPVVRPGRRTEQPWLDQVLARHPTLLDEFFWPDGMIRVAGREFNGLLETPCFQRGKMSCLSCHAMHGYQAPADQLAPARDTNEACYQCHEPYRDRLTEHTHHAAGSPGSLCYNCHQPHTSYALLKAVRSHQVSSPDIGVALATGRPDACSLCHLDRPLPWTAKHLQDRHGIAPPEIPAAWREVAAGVRWLQAGDAGQRALLAWHFGWEPARQAAGEGWLAPHLGVLLDDPYAAVRNIAHASLRRLPGFQDFAFDPVVVPGTRLPAVDGVWSRWPPAASGESSDAALRLLKPDGTVDVAGLRALVGQRDDRPIRLRE